MSTHLTSEQRITLETAHRFARDKRSAYRVNAILLWDDGFSFEEIAAILRLDEATLRRYWEQYQKSGLDGLLETNYSGGTAKLTALQQSELAIFLDQTVCLSTLEIIAYVQASFGVQYSASGMAKLLKSLGFVYKKPKLVPGKIDVAAQYAFVEYYETIKASMDATDKIYFVDGVHPQYNSMPFYGWIRKGGAKPLASSTGRSRVNINGALDPDTLEVIAKVEKTLDSEATINFLKLIEEKNRGARKIVLFVDNARYYYNGDVMEYVSNSSQLEMVFLPPYAPNLNLIERLWRFMKKKTLYNKYYPSFKDFKGAIGEFFMRLPEYYDELSGFITDDFQIIGSHQYD